MPTLMRRCSALQSYSTPSVHYRSKCLPAERWSESETTCLRQLTPSLMIMTFPAKR